jgi:hypothetical protein
MRGRYQFANRLTALWFLHQHTIPSHLLFIYFTGDDQLASLNQQWDHDCPVNPADWKDHPIGSLQSKCFLSYMLTLGRYTSFPSGRQVLSISRAIS